jgi:predicted DNA-binding WGR domain protein
MTAIMLTRIDERRHVARFYKLDIQPTLFGGWSFIREWGRIGRAGKVLVELHETHGTADLALISKWAEKRSAAISDVSSPCMGSRVAPSQRLASLLETPRALHE